MSDPRPYRRSYWETQPEYLYPPYKSTVKLTFFKGASLEDPARLFNSSLDGKVRRAIDIHEGEEIDAKAFKALIRAAVALNTSGGRKGAKKSADSADNTDPQSTSVRLGSRCWYKMFMAQTFYES